MVLKRTVLLVFIVFTLFGFTAIHDYYVSITQVEFVKSEKAVQITTRLFLDDLEKALQKNYGDTLKLNSGKNEKIIDNYLSRYLKQALTIKINGKQVPLDFLGKEYDIDVAICYIEIKNIEAITSFEVSNTALFNVFDNQENIVRTLINSKHKTFVLDKWNTTGSVKF